MDKALNEIGRLRNEMKVGFIELENQLQSNNDSLQKKIQETSQLTIEAMERFSKKVEVGFIAVEEAVENDLGVIKKEIVDIKKRLDQGNL
ncbi:MAG: hypothetical protein RIE59_12375 [Imperialibacter sp.]